MIDDKFKEIIPTNRYMVGTETGMVNVISSNKTKEYDVWEVKTSEYSMKCADEHIVFDNNYNEIYVKNLKVGDLIVTAKGPQRVKEINKLNYSEEMYDLTVDGPYNRYLANGILQNGKNIETILDKQ